MACDQLIKLKLSYLTKLFEFISEIRDKKWFYRLRWISIKEFRYYNIIKILVIFYIAWKFIANSSQRRTQQLFFTRVQRLLWRRTAMKES
jgi:hypothetical protein